MMPRRKLPRPAEHCRRRASAKETLNKARLTALHAICLQIFRHIAQKSLAIRQYACGISMQSAEKSDYASYAQALFSVSLTNHSISETGFCRYRSRFFVWTALRNPLTCLLLHAIMRTLQNVNMQCPQTQKEMENTHEIMEKSSGSNGCRCMLSGLCPSIRIPKPAANC